MPAAGASQWQNASVRVLPQGASPRQSRRLQAHVRSLPRMSPQAWQEGEMTTQTRHIRPHAQGPEPLALRPLLAVLFVLVAGWTSVAFYAGRLIGWW